MPNQISNEKIAALLKKQDVKRTYTRRAKDPTEPREYATWWSMETHFGNCENENCEDDLEQRTEAGVHMVAHVNGKLTCRRCFLGGWNRTSDL